MGDESNNTNRVVPRPLRPQKKHNVTKEIVAWLWEIASARSAAE